MWYTGIDWADEHHDALTIDEKGHQMGSIRVDHTPQGLAKLDTFLMQIIGSASKEQMACIIETTHGLLIVHLLEAGWPVYPVNPRTVDRRRSASGAKTDTIDAYLLAKTGRADFADLHQKSTLGFLRAYPTLETARAASLQEVQQQLKHTRHPHPADAAASIVELLHHPQLQADVVLTRTKSRLMLALVSQLLPLMEQIANYDKEIHTLFLTHEDHAIFESLPRAGQHLAPRRLSEIGDDRQRYQDASSLQALAGTSPVLYQSGMYSKAHRRLGCITPLRNALHQFAWQSTQSEAWAQDYYQRKRTEGKSHTVAIRALANVWVRIIFAMWTHRECYQTATFELAQQHHARRAA